MLAELAVALRGLGKHAEAERCCTAAVGARPDYQRGWLELGRAQAAQGELVEFALQVLFLMLHQYQQILSLVERRLAGAGSSPSSQRQPVAPAEHTLLLLLRSITVLFSTRITAAKSMSMLRSLSQLHLLCTSWHGCMPNAASVFDLAISIEQNSWKCSQYLEASCCKILLKSCYCDNNFLVQGTFKKQQKAM